MESIEAFVRLLAAFVTASLAPGLAPTTEYVDPGSELRLPLLSQAAEPAEDLTGVTRWQQVDELPSDLPDDPNAGGDDKVLDADQEGSGGSAPPNDEPLDAPLDDELADDELVDDEFADEEPLDDEVFLDDEFADDELIDEPAFADEPLDAPLADTFAGGDTSTVTTGPAPTRGTATLPDGFGSGQTFVSNPPAGAEAATVPDDCDAVVQNGRAVVGVGCGDDDGPWWLPLAGQPHPAAAPGTSSAQAAEFPFNQSGPPPGFPFDDNSGPFASDSGGVVIAAPSRSSDRGTVSIIEVDGAPGFLRDDDTVARANVVSAERIERQPERDNERAEAIRRQRSDIEARIPIGRQVEQTSRPGLKTATQPANARQAKRAKANASAKLASVRTGAKLNPCQNAKRIANNPRSAKNDMQLAKAKANCRQFKKTQQREAGR